MLLGLDLNCYDNEQREEYNNRKGYDTGKSLSLYVRKQPVIIAFLYCHFRKSYV